MRTTRGNTTLRLLAIVVVAALIGLKLVYRGYAAKLEAREAASQNTPLEWPPKPAPASDSVCDSVKLTMAQVDKANEEGLAVDQARRCITRETRAAHDLYLAERAAQRAQREATENKQALEQKLQAELDQAVAQQVGQGAISLQNLAQARSGKSTQVAQALLKAPEKPEALPQPPAELFVPSTYQSGGMELASFVSPNPKDGQRHPAIVWLTGGDSNTLGRFWNEGDPSNDQSASAFRKAGMVMMFPALRGGNSNPGTREYFWGEVDDVIAAVLHVAKLPYVDPTKIYLGGHSTGGTLALLAAGTGLPIAGVFAFGPVADPSTYARDQLPVNWKLLGDEELRLRAPKHWMHAVAAPTWIIEGAKPPANVPALAELCQARKSDQVQCVLVAGEDHFSVLQPLTRRIAAQIVMGQQPKLESTATLP